MVGGHSHDAADQVDDVLEADTAGRRALLISLAGLGLTAAIQAAVVVLSGSVALLGDTLHNVADALTAVPLLVAFRLARRPPTRRFTYGYGRAEGLGGLFVIAVITLSSVLACYEAIDRLIHPRDVSHLWAVAVAAIVGFAGNEIVARYRIRVGHRIGSAALVADGLHRRVHQSRGAARGGRCRVGLAAGRPDPRPGDHGSDPGCAALRDSPGRRPADGRRRPEPRRAGHRSDYQRHRHRGGPRSAHPLDRAHPARRSRRHGSNRA